MVPSWQSLQVAERRALVVGAIGLLIVALVALADVPSAARALLIAWLFWLDISLGSAALLLMQRLTGGAWIEPLRPSLHGAMAALPLLTVLFVPLVFALPALYPWAQAGAGPTPQHHAGAAAFAIRAFAILIAWSVAALWWRRRRGAIHATTAAVWILVFSITVTYAAFDWIASRQTDWSSTVFGMIVMVCQMLVGLPFALLFVGYARRIAPDESGALTSSLCRDIGNVLLSLIMMSAYLQFVQFLIIWAEDLPLETSWYLARAGGAWQSVIVAILFLQFIVPFAALLFRRLKDDFTALFALAVMLVVAGWLQAVWWVGPVAVTARAFGWEAALATIGVGGVWLCWVSYAVRTAAAAGGMVTNDMTEAHRHG